MAIIYRTAGPWGAGKGANLVPGEVDGNFYSHETRLATVEDTIPTLTSITGFTVSGNSFYVHLSDNSVQGPFVLPQTTWTFRGPWQPFTTYSTNDVVTAEDGGVYMVLYDHTSAASFSPGANDGAGHSYYGLMLMQTSVLPPGGGVDQVLSKITGDNYNVQWRAINELPDGGSAGQVLSKASDLDGDTVWDTPSLSGADDISITVPTDRDYLAYDATLEKWVNQQPTMLKVSHGGSFVPASSDIGAFVVVTNGTTDITITVPTDDDVDFPVGAEITLHQDGTGTITISPDTGVSLLYHASFLGVLLGQYATATIKKTAANEWRLFGLLLQQGMVAPNALTSIMTHLDIDSFTLPTITQP